eukprot:GHRR01012414.1.p1 GENE.GHRR01012414.1~~GHRR01012414.1.p1  ORF type:complete len:181 (+),score=44.90 GHRR01012414.1:1653-2195(+)
MQALIGTVMPKLVVPGHCIHTRLAGWPTGASRDLRTYAQRGSSAEMQKAVPVVEYLQWKTPLSIIKYPDPKLRAVNAKIGVFDDKLRQLAQQMFQVMYEDDGVGLAAPQVGVNIRLMVFNETAERGNPAETVLVNPEIVEKGKVTDIDVEGCLSFPQVYADVEVRVGADYATAAGAISRC